MQECRVRSSRGTSPPLASPYPVARGRAAGCVCGLHPHVRADTSIITLCDSRPPIVGRDALPCRKQLRVTREAVLSSSFKGENKEQPSHLHPRQKTTGGGVQKRGFPRAAAAAEGNTRVNFLRAAGGSRNDAHWLRLPCGDGRTPFEGVPMERRRRRGKEKRVAPSRSGRGWAGEGFPTFSGQTASSIVSIVFGTRKIAWAHVNRRLAVQDWQQQECTMFMKGAYMPAVYLEEISSVISRLPEADFYVLEKSGLSALNANLFPVTLHLRTVEAMLYALLQKTFSQDGQYKVLSMARSAVGKHFELMVGDSRTSGIDLVKQFLLESVTHAEPRVSFSREQVVNYRNVLSSNKQWRDEELCDSLLQAIAFYELLILNTT
uniref:Transcription elongation factor, mitochondrial n=1 Tax=Podarcis muralis TaxID=64176 RepID=A0A670IDI1_PODMU